MGITLRCSIIGLNFLLFSFFLSSSHSRTLSSYSYHLRTRIPWSWTINNNVLICINFRAFLNSPWMVICFSLVELGALYGAWRWWFTSTRKYNIDVRMVNYIYSRFGTLRGWNLRNLKFYTNDTWRPIRIVSV